MPLLHKGSPQAHPSQSHIISESKHVKIIPEANRHPEDVDAIHVVIIEGYIIKGYY
jgi:hypothetical protein